MKRTFTTIALATLTSFSALAQQDVEDGFYRVQNAGSGRYTYIYDCTGGVNLSTHDGDMGAIALRVDPSVRFDDPGSVIQIKRKGANGKDGVYALDAQGTGVYQIIKYNVAVHALANGTFWVYEPTHNLYLWDGYTGKVIDPSFVTIKAPTNPKEEYRQWRVHPISASSDEYLGITPNPALRVDGSYYKPYYIAFPYALASSGMKAYYVSDIKSDAVIIKEVTGDVPAATPVIIKCSSANSTANRIDLKLNTPSHIDDCKLQGNYFCYGNHAATDRLPYDAKTMRVLGVKDGKLCYLTDNEHKYTTKLTINGTVGYYINANESYLKVAADFPASLPVMTEAEYAATHAKAGDINGDNLINATDVAVLYRLISEGATAATHPTADVNGDGSVNATDVAVLYRKIAEGN